jgi:lactam utilization protein B
MKAAGDVGRTNEPQKLRFARRAFAEIGVEIDRPLHPARNASPIRKRQRSSSRSRKSALARAGEAAGLPVAREVFADRNYQPDGALVPRTESNAILHDPEEAVTRVLRMLREGVVSAIDGSEVAIEAETVCVHGDTPEAVAFAKELRQKLAAAGIKIAPPAVS